MNPSKFRLIKQVVQDMDIDIVQENPEQKLLVVTDRLLGIHNMHIGCQPPIVFIEQIIMDNPGKGLGLYSGLLKINRNLQHGAFVLDDDTEALLFRDTLELENLDKNEIKASVNALSLSLMEFGDTLSELATQDN